jgi:hypothetical protein
MIDETQFQADCSRCFGLCCTALRLERSDGFGHDKPPGIPCHFLEASYTCKIHPRREDLGYQGCIDFTCLGAGQRASRAFAGQNWQRNPAVASQLFARFAQLLALQEIRQALIDAEQMQLEEGMEHERKATLKLIAEVADQVERPPTQQVNDILRTAKNLIKNLNR